jgi:hypothetical protein
MNTVSTMQAVDDGRFFTFDPHRLPFSGTDVPQFESSTLDISACEIGESTEIDAFQVETDFASF